MRILLRNSEVLGWKTHNDKIRLKLVALGAEVISSPYAPSLLQKAQIKPYGKVFGALRVPLVSPIRMSERTAPRALPEQLDVIYAASHIGLGGLEHAATRRIATVDACIPQVAKDFGARHFTRKDIADEERILSQCETILCMSEWTMDGLSSAYPSLSSRLRLLPPYVPAPTVSSPDVKRRRREALSWPEDKLIVAHVSNSFARKGGWVVQALASALPEVDFHIFGKASKSFRRTSNLWLHHVVPNERLVSEYLAAADILVLPSEVDMAPHVLGEAVAAGCALITSGIGGLPELCVDGENGFIADNRDAALAHIRTLDADRSLLETFQAASVARAHSTSQTAEDIIVMALLKEGLFA